MWDADGNTFIAIENICFRVHSSYLSPLINDLPYDDIDRRRDPLIRLPRGGISNSSDVEALLELAYNRSQERRPEQQKSLAEAQFVQTARVLRAATQFEFPDLREAALTRLRELYPPRPAPFACVEWRYVHEATRLAIDCRAREILPSLLYAIVTTSDFEIHDIERTDSPPPENENTRRSWDKPADHETRGRTLSRSTTRLCVQLMNRIMDHFSPILFTVPTSSHMACTGVFADHWMEHAIQPAITDSGVYKPLETLKKIQGVDWMVLGLCESCCTEKEEEWKHEADDIWARIEGWVDLDAVFT